MNSNIVIDSKEFWFILIISRIYRIFHNNLSKN